MTVRVVFGGTFDPVTCGHRAIAAEVHRRFPRSLVHLVPTAAPPHRRRPAAPFEHRAAMLCAAFAGDRWALVDRREARIAGARPGPVHAIDVVEDLRREFGPCTDLLWVLGQDSFASLSDWHRCDDLIAAVAFIVIPRPPAGPGDGPAVPTALRERVEFVPDPGALVCAPRGRAWILGAPLSAASATGARERLASGRSTQGLLPPAVARYARVHGLYGAPASPSGSAAGPARGGARAPGTVENHDA